MYIFSVYSGYLLA